MVLEQPVKRTGIGGVDGIMVSNHGARQLDNSPAPLQVLPAINEAVGDKMTVMFDGGIRFERFSPRPRNINRSGFSSRLLKTDSVDDRREA